MTSSNIVSNDGRKHNERCEHSRKKYCKCRCRGRYHGKESYARTHDPNDKPMTMEMGGEIAAFLASMKGLTMECWCKNELICAGFMGYPHDAGLADATGQKWWVFLNCEKCNYDWSFWKVENRARAKVEVTTV